MAGEISKAACRVLWKFGVATKLSNSRYRRNRTIGLPLCQNNLCGAGLRVPAAYTVAMRKLLVVATLLIASSACAQTAPWPAGSDALIRAARERSNHAIATRDLAAFADTLADNFRETTGRGTFIASREEYVQAFAAEFASPSGAITYLRMPDAIDLSAALPEAAEHGRWKGMLADGRVVYTGVYLAMWRYAPAGWKLRSELYVTLACVATLP
jgi:ketosteroid isomerase-like protein